MQRSNEFPRPGGWEITNFAFTLVDGGLILAAMSAQRLDLALLATSGVAVGFLNSIRMDSARWKLWVRANRRGGMEN